MIKALVLQIAAVTATVTFAAPAARADTFDAWFPQHTGCLPAPQQARSTPIVAEYRDGHREIIGHAQWRNGRCEGRYQWAVVHFRSDAPSIQYATLTMWQKDAPQRRVQTRLDEVYGSPLGGPERAAKMLSTGGHLELCAALMGGTYNGLSIAFAAGGWCY